MSVTTKQLDNARPRCRDCGAIASAQYPLCAQCSVGTKLAENREQDITPFESRLAGIEPYRDYLACET